MFATIKFILLIQIGFNTINAQLTSTFVRPLVSGTCGISTGGPLVQKLTRSLTDTIGLFWSDDGVKLAYVERFGPAYGRYTPSDGRFNRMAINEGKEAIAIFPVKNDTGLKFVIGLDNRLVLADVTGSGNLLQSTIYPLVNVSNDPNEYFNMGKVDNKGRLWYSSSRADLSSGGKLYKIENLQVTELMEDDLYGSAGMAWTQDYKYFYLVDEFLGIIYKYNFNSNAGKITNRRTIFRLAEHDDLEGNGLYAIAIDNQGYLWIGLLRAGTVLQYDERTKNILWKIEVPASEVVSLEFGGLDKKTLYVGTSKYYLKQPKRQPAAGAIFSISGTGATGFEDNEIVIPEKYRD